MDVIVNLQFSLIEKLWQTFWRYSPSAPADDAAIIELRSVNVSLLTVQHHDITAGVKSTEDLVLPIG